jgi:hypothetical protein
VRVRARWRLCEKSVDVETSGADAYIIPSSSPDADFLDSLGSFRLVRRRADGNVPPSSLEGSSTLTRARRGAKNRREGPGRRDRARDREARPEGRTVVTS